MRQSDRFRRDSADTQRGQDDALLERRVARRPDRSTQFEWHPQRTRRPGILRLRPDQRDHDRCDALFLQIMPQRAHGARAERSNRRKNGRVDSIGFQPAGQLARVGLHLHRVGRTHERVVHRGDRADGPLRRQVVEPIKRKDDVPVLLEPGSIEIDRDVAAGRGRQWWTG
jgi:hypothetical protein